MEISSSTWKRAAKEERMWRIKFRAQAFETVEELERWVEIADRRLKFMQYVEKHKKVCIFCYSRWHTNDCEWAKELADAEKES